MLALNGNSSKGAGSKVKKENNTRAKIDKMRNLLRYESLNFINMTYRPDEQLFYKRLPKKLEFGHTFVSQYKKHVGGAVKSIFWNPNTQ